MHVRDPASGKPSAELGLFEEVIAGIRDRCNAIVQPTTGGGVGMTIDERARVLSACRPELASFNVGSFNFGIFQVRHRPEMEPWEIDYLESTREYVFRNTFADTYRLAELFREAGTKPELETYDVGHLYNVAHLLEQELLDPPLHIQFVLGVLGANAATLEQLLHMRAHRERALRRRGLHVVGGRGRLPGGVSSRGDRAHARRSRPGRARGQPAARRWSAGPNRTRSSSRRR